LVSGFDLKLICVATLRRAFVAAGFADAGGLSLAASIR
jgi:hypothetical protein